MYLPARTGLSRATMCDRGTPARPASRIGPPRDPRHRAGRPGLPHRHARRRTSRKRLSAERLTRRARRRLRRALARCCDCRALRRRRLSPWRGGRGRSASGSRSARSRATCSVCRRSTAAGVGVAGSGIGLAAAAGFATLLGSMLYGRQPANPLTLSAWSPLALALAAMLAAYVPAPPRRPDRARSGAPPGVKGWTLKVFAAISP